MIFTGFLTDWTLNTSGVEMMWNPKITDACRIQYRRRQCGFSLLELSVALVVIAIIVGITIVGVDVYRNAMGVRLYSDYIQGWVGAFNTYVTRSGGVLPGDNQQNPTGMVMGRLNTPLCDQGGNSLALSTTMLQVGVTLPTGRGPNQAARYVYQDKSGVPHELNVCLVTTSWTVPTQSNGGIVYSPVTKTVLRISGLTPDLASQLSSMIDGRIDAGLGSLREFSPVMNDTAQQSMGWSINATQDIHGGTNPEQQSAEITADLLLN